MTDKKGFSGVSHIKVIGGSMVTAQGIMNGC